MTSEIFESTPQTFSLDLPVAHFALIYRMKKSLGEALEQLLYDIILSGTVLPNAELLQNHSFPAYFELICHP